MKSLFTEAARRATRYRSIRVSREPEEAFFAIFARRRERFSLPPPPHTHPETPLCFAARAPRGDLDTMTLGRGGGRERKGSATRTTDTIFIYRCVRLCFIMSRWKASKKRRMKESCIQMKECRGRRGRGEEGRVGRAARGEGPGEEGNVRWDPGMTLLLGDLYSLVE